MIAHTKLVTDADLSQALDQNYLSKLCPIQDPNWMGYSYDEIIEMNNEGYSWKIINEAMQKMLKVLNNWRKENKLDDLADSEKCEFKIFE